MSSQIDSSAKNRFFNLMHYTWTLLAIWTIVVGGLLAREYMNINTLTNQIALNTARAHLNKDKSIRLWGSVHGGVYIPVMEDTQPNPYLSMIKERDLTTASGKQLTLMNPEYMLRHLNETFAELYGVASHITSLKPLRPENGPDEWEKAALHAFERGADEIIEIIDDQELGSILRMMQPLYVKPECLKCHGHQGYKIGDIRGGLGIRLPMNEFIKQSRKQLAMHTISLVLLWLLGTTSIIIGSEKLRKSTSKLSQSNIVLQKEVEDRKKAEVALKKESSFTSAVLDTAGALIMVLDDSGKIIRFNQACERLSGYTAHEADGQFFWDLLLPTSESLTAGRHFHNIQEKNYPKKLVTQLLSRQGDRRVIDWSNTIFLNEEGLVEYLICIGIDITEEKLLQEQLLHAEKLSAVGKLSASIAHEINNPLFGIRNVLERIKEKGNLNNDNFEFADLAVQECDRIKNLIKDLQDFNRPTSGVLTPISLHKSIDNMLMLSKKTLENKRIGIHKEFSSDINKIMAIDDQIKQVLLNLINNAIEAIDNNGLISISTRKKENYAIIQITDNGSGIIQEDLAHIFEPFFTTKSAVKGTGLGLSVTYGIIKKHGGNINVASKIGKGTTFTIELPIEGGV